MSSDLSPGYAVKRTADAHWAVTYVAMASPCEILVRCKKESEAQEVASLSYEETLRIERKFSRYRQDNIIHAINHSEGAAVAVDEETARLLSFAGECHDLSDGRFDITSGVLRRAWQFDGGVKVPDEVLIESLRDQVGWGRVRFDGSTVCLPRGMEIDLGGIGKEYAADRVAALAADVVADPVLVNLGGDICARSGGDSRHRWTIGIEEPGRDKTAVGQIEINHGGIATSGDSRRFCMVGGKRLGHVIDPRTGWPVAGAPHSVTVVYETCTAAGFLATTAMLHGPDAEAFLASQEVTYHCIR